MKLATPALAGSYLVLALGLGLGAGPAAANMAAPPPPARVSGLGSAGGPTPLEVKAADLVIDCSAGADACRLEVTYQLHNPSTVTAGGTAAFYAVDTDDVIVTVDGQPSGKAIADDAAAELDATVVAASGADLEPSRYGGRMSRHGFALSLAPDASAQIVVTGTIHPTERHRYYMAIPAAPARHRLLVRGGRTDRRVELQYFVAPIRTWSGFPAAMTFTLKHPASWIATVDGATGLDAQQDGGVTVHHGRIATSEPSLTIELETSARDPLHAGLLLGLGGQLDDAGGVRVRAGVEAGRGSYLASLALELERGDDTGVVIVPALTAASPWLLIIPSVGLGLGVPVRLRPSLEVGGRFLADLHFGPVGMLMALDYYPGMAADPRRFEVSLLGQLAL